MDLKDSLVYRVPEALKAKLVQVDSLACQAPRDRRDSKGKGVGRGQEARLALQDRLAQTASQDSRDLQDNLGYKDPRVVRDHSVSQDRPEIRDHVVTQGQQANQAALGLLGTGDLKDKQEHPVS